MAPHARDSETEIPVEKDNRVPLAEVVFNFPTKIAGISMMLTTIEAGVNRLVDGKEWCPPSMWLDKGRRLVSIGEYTYPLERVHYFRQAKAAITKKPQKLDLEKYTVGKRTLF